KGGWLLSQVENDVGAVVRLAGGSGNPFVMVCSLIHQEPPSIATKRNGDGYAQVGRPGIKETGAHRGALRTAAIKRYNRAQKMRQP
uniref:hypothetical protein n=1 Tax=uncultured Pseudomonas sp. TaxID=114707 RepID=UPI00258F7279